MQLIQCAGPSSEGNTASAQVQDLQLQMGLVKCLTNRLRLFSVTLTRDEPAALLLEKEAMSYFGGSNVLLGNTEDPLVPIMLDLKSLPLEATGIVCGVAGKLTGLGSESIMDAVEMSYLSTARTGMVMVDQRDLGRTIEALRQGDNAFEIDD